MTGTDFDKATAFKFCYSTSGGATKRVNPSVLNASYAQVSLSELSPETTYSVWAEATASTGVVVTSSAKSFTTGKAVALPSHTDWLELPAQSEINTAAEHTYYSGERNYTILYDTKKYAGLWVAYPLSKSHSGDLSRPDNWAFAPDIDEEDQIDLTNSSYGVNVSGTIYSRGHQIPNGDRNGNSTMQNQTFYVINSTPQIQDKFNGGIWSSLENAIRGALPSSASVYVVTGPVYQTVGGSESIKTIEAQDDKGKKIPVPNYYFKAILKVKKSGGVVVDASAVGFWFEHKQYSNNSWEDHIVSIDEIEQKTGFDLFANLPDTIEKSVEQNATSWSDYTSFSAN